MTYTAIETGALFISEFLKIILNQFNFKYAYVCTFNVMKIIGECYIFLNVLTGELPLFKLALRKASIHYSYKTKAKF